MEKEYKGLQENLERFKNDLTDEKMRLLFSIAYKQGYDQALSIANVSKRHLIEDILERMDGVFPDYHYDIVKDYLNDDC